MGIFDKVGGFFKGYLALKAIKMEIEVLQITTMNQIN